MNAFAASRMADWVFTVKRGVPFLLVAMCAGCAIPPTRTLSLALAEQPEARQATGKKNEALRIIAVEVMPVTEQSFGNILGSRLIASGLDERLLAALNGIKAKGVRVEAKPGSAASQPEPGIVRISFAKAYIHGIHDTKSAVVVLKVERAGRTRYVRSQRTSLNWTNGDNEFQNALIRALNDAVAKLRPDLLTPAVDDSVMAAK